MFTGIIREIGTVTKTESQKGLLRLYVQAPKTASGLEPLESISVNGVCLSLVCVRKASLVFEVIPETLRLTNLGRLRCGSRVNIEPSLSLSDRINGHIVLGHIDGTGTVCSRRWLGGELVLGIRLSKPLAHLLAAKGSVTVDGVSLTVGPKIRNAIFTVHLIPETLRQTTLEHLRVKSAVNIEIDYLAKLVRSFLQNRT